MQNGFAVNLDQVKISDVVILKNHAAGELFLNKIFPLYGACYFYTVDESYPINIELKEKVKQTILNNEKCSIVTFGVDCLEVVKPRSERILVMDKIILSSYKTWDADKDLRSNVQAIRIASIMESFFSQWVMLEEAGTYSEYYSTYEGFDQSALDWRLELLGGRVK